MSAFLATNTRTHSCGALRAGDVGKHVVLTGWVDPAGRPFRTFRGLVALVVRPHRNLPAYRCWCERDPGARALAYEPVSDEAGGVAYRKVRTAAPFY